MKFNKIKKILAAAMLGFGLVSTNIVLTKSVGSKQYLVTSHDYFQDEHIDKGFLDLKIKDVVTASELEKLNQAATNGTINFNEEMTYIEFYKANNYSIEDAYSGYQKIRNSAGMLINTNPNKYGDLTYVGPIVHATEISNDKVRNVYSPTMFSRLTVGNLNEVEVRLGDGSANRAEFGKYSGNYAPNTLLMNQTGTVMDYMLTEQNNIVIPARFNTLRDDVYLTMRSKTPAGIGLRGLQAYLKAEEINIDDAGIRTSQPISSKNQDENFYINTSAKILLTEAGYNNMGFTGRLQYEIAASQVNANLADLGVNEFANEMNKGLRMADDSAGSGQITSGLGGQVQLKGFFRKSPIDNNFLVSEADRQKDSTKSIEATYFMYSTGETAKDPASVQATRIPDKYKDDIPTWDDSKLNILSSPNVSVYSIEVTRPVFYNFKDLSEKINYDKNNFDDLIGLSSFNIRDNGLLKDGNPVSVDNTRVRVLINNEDKPYSLDELKVELELEKYQGKEIQLTYTYAASDADDSIIGKLPKDIDNNLGAYAVPFVRTVVLQKNNKPVTPIKPVIPTNPSQPNQPATTPIVEKQSLPNTGTKLSNLSLPIVLIISGLYLLSKKEN